MTTKEKFIKAGIILFLIALAAFFAYFFYLQILVARGELIQFNGQWYQKEDWQELYGEYDTPAKNTPEEVYTKFREALLEGDKETALGLIREERRQDYREAFDDEEKFLEWVEKLPLDIKLEWQGGNFADYNVNMGTGNRNIMSFEKNREGYWEID